MRGRIFSTLMLCLIVVVFAACHKSPLTAVISEKYIHEYGAEVPQNDWIARGKNGVIVRTLRTGAVVREPYKNGLLSGTVEQTYPHRDVLAKSKIYDAGVLLREIDHYENGTPHIETSFEGDQNEIVSSWYMTGSPRSNESYSDGKLTMAQYFNTDGTLEGEVVAGFGERIRRDGYGELLSKDEIVVGIIEQRCTFYPNGDLQAVTPYHNGAVHGLRKTYFLKGEPHSIESWVNDQQEGLTQIYQGGELAAEIPYSKGMKNGLERRYKNGNELVEEILWENDTKNGPHRFYVDGRTKADWYLHDRVVTQAIYEDAQLIQVFR